MNNGEYEKLLLGDDVKEAIAKEQAFIEKGGDSEDQPDMGYNQWVEFIINNNNESLVLRKSDADIKCGKLYYLGDKGAEITKYPHVIFTSSSSTKKIGACGRYCAAVGTMGSISLREYDGTTQVIGEEVVVIQWKCLYSSYKYNFFHALTFNPNYEVTFNSNYPIDRALGSQTITIKRKPQ